LWGHKGHFGVQTSRRSLCNKYILLNIKGKTLAGHDQLPKGWWGKYTVEGLVGKLLSTMNDKKIPYKVQHDFQAVYKYEMGRTITYVFRIERNFACVVCILHSRRQYRTREKEG